MSQYYFPLFIVSNEQGNVNALLQHMSELVQDYVERGNVYKYGKTLWWTRPVPYNVNVIKPSIQIYSKPGVMSKVIQISWTMKVIEVDESGFLCVYRREAKDGAGNKATLEEMWVKVEDVVEA